MVKLALLFLLGFSQSGWAWGQRGHQAITRAAIRLLNAGEAKTLGQGYIAHEMHLSYLSNTPDTVWRSDSVSKSVRRKNAPTHYFSSEKLIGEVSREALAKFLKASWKKKNQFKEIGSKGSAPHRILQIQELLFKQLAQF
ncbi:hypothetical protein N9D31_04230, partial [Oligoflexaceae bacterium]|nr:hypothetical protein [Oligoflexaceae bacterium]